MKIHLAALALVLTMLASPARGADPSVALQSATEKFNAKQYREAVQIIAKELNSASTRTDAPPVAERYSLLMLKGECMLRLDQRSLSISTFAQAAKSAADAKDAALADANSMLAKASPNNKYPPRDRSAPIDILDPESRRQAFAAMYRDRGAELAPKLNKARDATALPPMIAVVEPLLDVAQVEYAAKGSAPESKALIGELREHAQRLITAELRRIHHRINALDDASNSATNTGGDDFGRRGLFSQEAQEVKETVKYLKEIERTCRDARKRGQQIGNPDSATWEPLIADAADLADRAEAMLNIAN